MIMGGALGLYLIISFYRNGLLRMQDAAIPILLILALFVWVSSHLIWIGKDHDMQLLEFTRIWKKIILCFPFALGLGLGIRYVIQYGSLKQSKYLWHVMYLGFSMPALIFFCKYVLIAWANSQDINLSPVFSLSTDWNLDYSMPKYFQVFFVCQHSQFLWA